MDFQKQEREFISNLPYNSNADWENGAVWTCDVEIRDYYHARTNIPTCYPDVKLNALIWKLHLKQRFTQKC